MLHSLESQERFCAPSRVVTGKIGRSKRSGRYHPYKHLRVSIPNHLIKQLPQQPYGNLPRAEPCALYDRLSTVSPSSSCSGDSGYGSSGSDMDADNSSVDSASGRAESLVCAIPFNRLPSNLSIRLRGALSTLPILTPLPLNCAQLADIYHQRTLACEQRHDYSATAMSTELSQQVLTFYQKPYFSYNRFMERNQYLCHTEEKRSEHDVFESYFTRVDGALSEIDQHLDKLISQGKLSKSESQFLFSFIVRSFLDTYGLASCVDKAGALIADILEHGDRKVIPMMGIVTFFKTKEGYQRFMAGNAAAWDLAETDNHAIVCAMPAKYYQSCRVKKRFTREVIARRPQSFQDYAVPSVLKKDHTMLCDGSTGGRFLYKGEWDWHGYIEDTDELLMAANPGSDRTRLDQGVYRAVVDWHPIF